MRLCRTKTGEYHADPLLQRIQPLPEPRYGIQGIRPRRAAILIFPCQSGRFFDWEDRNMCNLAAPWIDAGKLQIIAADSIDRESWDNDGPARPRIEMQERWYNYVCEELTPRALEINREQGPDHMGKVLVGGASMGAGHAVNLFLRRPDLYNGTIALSGLYQADMFFKGYMDDLVYRNSPCDYMRNFPDNHPYKELYGQSGQVHYVLRPGPVGRRTTAFHLAAAGYSGKQGYPSHC